MQRDIEAEQILFKQFFVKIYVQRLYKL